MWLSKEGAILPKSKRKYHGKSSKMETLRMSDFNNDWTAAQGVR